MAEIPEKWLTLPRAMRVWHGIALTPPEQRTSDFNHAAQVLDAQANEVALIVERLVAVEERLSAKQNILKGIQEAVNGHLGAEAVLFPASLAGKQS